MSTSARELDMLLKEAKFELLVPKKDAADDIESLVQSGERSCVFYDELLYLYLVCKFPTATSPSPQAFRALIDAVEITVTASTTDFSASNAGSSSNNNPTQSSADPSPKLGPSSSKPASNSTASRPPQLPPSSSPQQNQQQQQQVPPNPLQHSPQSSLRKNLSYLRDASAALLSSGRSSPQLDTKKHSHLPHQHPRSHLPKGRKSRSGLSSVLYGRDKDRDRGDFSIGDFYYSYVYDPSLDGAQPVLSASGSIGVCPFKIPLDIVKVRDRFCDSARIHLSLSIVQKDSDRLKPAEDTEWCDTENHDLVNVLGELGLDPHFNPEALPSHRLHYQIKRKPSMPTNIAPPFTSILKKSVPIRPALTIRLHPAAITHEQILVGVEVSNNLFYLSEDDHRHAKEHSDQGQSRRDEDIHDYGFDLKDVQIDVADAIITRLDAAGVQFPTSLSPATNVNILYSITLIDPFSADGPQASSPTGSLNLLESTNGGLSSASSVASSRSSSLASLPAALQSSGMSNAGTGSSRRPLLNITVKGTPQIPGCRKQTMTCRWYWRMKLDASGLMNDPKDIIIPKQGRKYMFKSSRDNPQQHMDDTLSRSSTDDLIFRTGWNPVSGLPSMVTNSGGVSIGFSVVDTHLKLRKIFTVQVFLVNKSDRVRNLSLMVPNKTPSSALGDVNSRFGIDLSGSSSWQQTKSLQVFMDEEEFLRKWFDNENREATLVCLENNVKLSPLYPNTCQSVSLHFIAIKGHLHTIDTVQLVDRDQRLIMNMRNVLQVAFE